MPESLLIMRHGAEILGVDLRDVREISRMVLLRRLPGAPAAVLGAMDLGGQVIPVLDLEARLPVGSTRPGVDSYLVILAPGEPVIDFAFAATRIEDIEPLGEGAFQPAQGSLPPSVPLSGMARTSLGWVPVLEPRNLLVPGESLTLREAVRRLSSHLPETSPAKQPEGRE